MSVIAWDGKVLAADKRALSGTLIRTTTKIFASERALMAYAGDSDAGEEIMAWFTSGRKPEHFPSSQRDKDTWAGFLVVFNTGDIWKYERTPYPIKFPPQQFAIGSGRDFAMAAMYCGKSAPEAVEVACVFDSGCGNGVDVLTHSETAGCAKGQTFSGTPR
jgi:hypothetical protein